MDQSQTQPTQEFPLPYQSVDGEQVPVGPHQIMVIQFGSKFVRFGLASDPLPTVVPCVAAYNLNLENNDSTSNLHPKKEEALVVHQVCTQIHSTAPYKTKKKFQNSQNLPQSESNSPKFPQNLQHVADTFSFQVRRRGGGKPQPWLLSEDHSLVAIPVGPQHNEGIKQENNVDSVSCKHDADQSLENKFFTNSQDKQNQTSSWLSSDLSKLTIFDPSSNNKLAIGWDAFRLAIFNQNNLPSINPSTLSSQYKAIWPFRNGRMNFKEYGRGTVKGAFDHILIAIIKNLKSRIKWESDQALETASEQTMLDQKSNGSDQQTLIRQPTPTSKSNPICVILILPEEARRSDTYEMITSLYQASVDYVCLHHSSVATTYGAGLSSAVIVDIGHTSSYVVCVDDGTVSPESRVRLKYGAAHALTILKKLLSDNLTSMSEKEETEVDYLTEKIMENVSNLENTENDISKTVDIVSPFTKVQGKLSKFRFTVGLAYRFVPSYGLLFPSLYKSIHPGLEFTLGSSETLSSQSYLTDEDYAIDGQDDDSEYIDLLKDPSRGQRANAARAIGYFPDLIEDGFMAIDKAIIHSINRAIETRVATQISDSEFRSKFFESILLAGGLSHTIQLGDMLEKQLESLSPSSQSIQVLQNAGSFYNENTAEAVNSYRAASPSSIDSEEDENDLMELIEEEKDVGPSMLAWKGGAVIGNTAASVMGEMWVSKQEWNVRGMRSFREKSPFYF